MQKHKRREAVCCTTLDLQIVIPSQTEQLRYEKAKRQIVSSVSAVGVRLLTKVLLEEKREKQADR